MKDAYPHNFGQFLSMQAKQFTQWVKPDPEDHILLSVGKLVFKSMVILFLILISPVLLIGLAFAFIGLL